MTEQTHLLHVGDKAYHLRSGRTGTVIHVSALRARNAADDDWTVRCRVGE